MASPYESTSSAAAARERDLEQGVRPAEACRAVAKAAKDILKAASRRHKLLKEACKALAGLPPSSPHSTHGTGGA